MKKLLVWFSNTKIYSEIVLKIIPFIRFSLYYTSLRGNVYKEAYKLIKKGDIIVAKDDKKLTALLIGGEWTHASLFMGKDNDYEVAEMTHHHYTKSDFFDVAKESTAFAIFRCTDFDAEYIDKMIDKCKTFENAKYDVGFELGVKALYCSELIYQSDYERRLKVNLDDLHALGRKYISPTGLSKGLNLELVYDSRKTKNRY